MKTSNVKVTVISIGVENGKSIVRVAIERDGQSGVQIRHIDTNLKSFAELAALGVQVINL